MDLKFWFEKRVIVVYAVSLLALAEIIDLSIVAVAIPQIMSALDTNMDSISMVSTTYIIAAAIFNPLAGIIIRKFTMKSVMLVSATIFCIFSILCGLAETFFEMVIFRFLQGVGGAFLPAVAQAYIEQTFQGEEKKKMMTIFSLVLVMGPIIGPIMGALLTGYMNWRFIFYVNVPICMIGFVLISLNLKPTKPELVNFDWISFILLFIGIGGIEYFIDQGHAKNWFESHLLVWVLYISSIAMIIFIYRGVQGLSVINFALFKNFNFVKNCILIFLFTLLMIASFAYFPTLLQNVYGYPVEVAGFIALPRGLCAAASVPIVRMACTRIGARETACLGIIVFSISCSLLTQFSPSVGLQNIITVTIFQGIGMISFFLPILDICFEGIQQSEKGDASGIFNFFRNFASSVGNSFAATMIAFQTSVSYVQLQSYLSPYERGYQVFTANLKLLNPERLLQMAEYAIEQNSLFMGYLDLYVILKICLIGLCFFPLLLWVKNSEYSYARILYQRIRKLKGSS
jgi:DHA2 family multidrug resistance protein